MSFPDNIQPVPSLPDSPANGPLTWKEIDPLENLPQLIEEYFGGNRGCIQFDTESARGRFLSRALTHFGFPPVKVQLAENEYDIRSALSLAIRNIMDYSIVGDSTGAATEILTTGRMLVGDAPDIVILDQNLGVYTKTGTDIFRRIEEVYKREKGSREKNKVRMPSVFIYTGFPLVDIFKALGITEEDVYQPIKDQPAYTVKQRLGDLTIVQKGDNYLLLGLMNDRIEYGIRERLMARESQGMDQEE